MQTDRQTDTLEYVGPNTSEKAGNLVVHTEGQFPLPERKHARSLAANPLSA